VYRLYTASYTVTTLTTSSLAEKAYDELRKLVTEGKIRTEPVSEVSLAEALQVSRTPVREAVRRLVGENILEVTPQGVRLYLPSVEDLAEVYYTRAILEGAAARLAASIDGRGLARGLRAIIRESKPMLDADDHEGLARLNGRFHRTIVAASGNRRIRELLDSLEPIIVRYRRMSLLYPDHQHRSYEDHVRIAELLEKGQPEEVEDYIREHILRAGARIVRATLRIDGGSVDTSSTAAVLLSVYKPQLNGEARQTPRGKRKGNRRKQHSKTRIR
jgi:DNA-binding GntR family transcriptional regulator